MNSTTFDTLKYSKRLQELGFSREQAEGFAEMQQELINDGLATKRDIQTLKSDLKELEYRLTIRLGTMLAASVAIIVALVKLI